MEWEKYTEIKPGTRERSKVAKLERLTASEAYPESYMIKAAENGRPIEPDAPVLRVTTENGARIQFNLPEGMVISPKSKLYAWKKIYKDYPAEGQEVETEVGERGWPEVVGFQR